jgi:hypothetical protein
MINYKIETTDENLTSQSGLLQYGELLHRLGLKQIIDEQFPKQTRGESGSEYILPLLLMYTGGGKRLSDIRQIYHDGIHCSCKIINKKMDEDTLGKWLKRKGTFGGVQFLKELSLSTVSKATKQSKNLTLDVDAYFNASEKYSATIGHKGKGFYPLATHISGGYITDLEFRLGNASPREGLLEAIQRTVAGLKKGIISLIRMDSAGYQSKIFNYCEEQDFSFVIAAQQNRTVIAVLDQIPEKEWKDYGDEYQIASSIHCMEKTKKSFRIVGLRKKVEQLSFDEEGSAESKYKIVIATNASHSDKAILKFYRQRGHHSENCIKEMKQGFGFDYLPFADHFAGNDFVMQIQSLAYNLFLLMKQIVLPSNFKKHLVSTVRWKFFFQAGKLVKHGRQYVFKVKQSFVELFLYCKAKINQIRPIFT